MFIWCHFFQSFLKTIVSIFLTKRNSTLNRSENFRAKWMKSHIALPRMFSMHMHKLSTFICCDFYSSLTMHYSAIMLCARRTKGVTCKWKLHIFGREYSTCREKKIARRVWVMSPLLSLFSCTMHVSGYSNTNSLQRRRAWNIRKVRFAENGFELSIFRYMPTGIRRIASCHLRGYKKIISIKRRKVHWTFYLRIDHNWIYFSLD